MDAQSLRDWASEVEEHLRRLSQASGRQGVGARPFLEALPPGYPESTSPLDAARDLLEASQLGSTDEARFVLGEARAAGSLDAAFRLRRVASSRLELSRLVSVLETFGLSVLEAVPWHFPGAGPGGLPVFVDDIAVRLSRQGAGFDPRRAEARLVEAVQAVLAGRAEETELNELVLRAGLGWREVNLLSAYREYRQLAGGPRAAERSEAMADGLVSYPTVAAAVVGLFSARLCPAGQPGEALVGASDDARGPREAGAALVAPEGPLASPGGGPEHLEGALAAVPDLAHYEALRELGTLVLATTRSNWSLQRETLAFKLDSREVPFLPEPRPYAEVFVWSPRFVGVHLRFGPVARGGLRWSDRQADLRAEVLGLARAQVKKNSLIVPTGAKGGFALRPGLGAAPGRAANLAPGGRPPALSAGAPGGTGEEAAARDAYRDFVGALLDLTDNVVAGRVRPPAGVVCRDGPDPYLVVAPDKGTAGFSDLANEVSTARGYWLGDAFASGGSHGYDHKALGITAKGAWSAVRRHFRALGMDVGRDQLRVVGVGDMSGDVFGNGMLQSSAIKLVAAFDHRHIFVDPDPEPAKAFEERRRLASLARSTWADYDLAAASEGARVYSRQDKSVELSEQAVKALGIVALRPGGEGQRQGGASVFGPSPSSSESAGIPGSAGRGASRVKLTPPELVRAVLSAPVDLLYFGGVGTFVRSAGERDAEVDDEANDEVRVSADVLRARVVAEGANLAMTQAARCAYARRGGRVNADFVDNAAGVAMSDREVNIKILLTLAFERGVLAQPPEVPATQGVRDQLLAAAEAGAADAVLAQVELSLVALDSAAATSSDDLPVWEAVIADFEAAGLLDREAESLPGPEELASRRGAGAGFTRPELAVLLAYARSELARSIEASSLVADPALGELAVSYFPSPLGGQLGHLVPEHPLYHQIVSSQLANEVIGRMGGLWAHEVSSEYCAPPWLAAAAYYLARQVLGLPAAYQRLDSAAASLPLETELELRWLLAAAAGRLARWYLGGDLLGPKPLGALVARDRQLAERLGEAAELQEAPSPLEALGDQGAPEDLLGLLKAATAAAAAGELGEVARSTGRQLKEAAEASQLLDAELGLAKLWGVVSTWSTPGRWGRRALHLLYDDLARTRASAAKSALVASPGLGPGEAVREWLKPRRSGLERAAPLLEELAVSKRPDLALASSALAALEVAIKRAEGL